MELIIFLIAILLLLCVLFRQGLGRILGLSYKYISVVFNLWIQGGILVLSAVMPLLQFIDHTVVCPTPGKLLPLSDGRVFLRFTDWMTGFIFLVLYFLVYVGLYIWMIRRYRLPFNAASNRWVDDLQALAREWHCSYRLVNLIIFVFLFLMVIGLNYMLTKLMAPTLFVIRF